MMKYRVKKQARGSIKGVDPTYGNHNFLVLDREIAKFYIYIYMYIVGLIFRVSPVYSGTGSVKAIVENSGKSTQFPGSNDFIDLTMDEDMEHVDDEQKGEEKPLRSPGSGSVIILTEEEDTDDEQTVENKLPQSPGSGSVVDLQVTAYDEVHAGIAEAVADKYVAHVVGFTASEDGAVLHLFCQNACFAGQ